MKQIILLLLFIIGTISPHATNDLYQYEKNPDHHLPRFLRGRGGGGRGGRGGRGRRSSYYSGSYSSKYKVRYTSRNSYLKNGRTYGPLYTYYRPLGYYHALGYYSLLYARIYYDGYGYNFYYGKYAYYESSPNDVNYADIITAIFTVLCICCCLGF